jgi:protein SCO1/2
MDRTQKLLMTSMWAVAVLAMITVVGAGLWARRQAPHDQPAAALEPLFPTPSFSLTDQNGATVSNASLAGKVWIGMLFFTNCPGVCPAMTNRMNDVQNAIPNPDVKVVLFSLDPEKDTPEAMKLYAERFETDQSRWIFLTGPKDTMFEIARGLKLPAEPAKDGNPILHSQKVLLIDRTGQVRGVYDTNDDDAMKQLSKDAMKLATQREKAS